jgi:hypothetical protein
MKRGCFNAHHLKLLEKIFLLAGYTGPIGFGTRAAKAPVTEKEPLDLSSSPAIGATPSHKEDLEEELNKEQAGEDKEVEVLGAFFSVLDMSFDVPCSQEG